MRRLIIAAVMMALISGCLFFMMSAPLNHSNIDAVNGRLDLVSAIDSEKTVFPLQGEWEFYYGELLRPSDFPKEEKKYITAPALWADDGYPEHGHATYRLTVITGKDKQLMLLTPQIYDAAQIWINGESVYLEGEIGTSKGTSIIGIQKEFIPFETINGQAEIVIQVSSYNYVYSGLENALKIGSPRAVLKNTLRQWGLSVLVLGCILMIGIYHFILFLFRKREQIYLYFALLCLFCFARFIFEVGGINDYFRLIPNETLVIRMYAVLWAVHGYLIIYFSLLVAESKWLQKRFIRDHGYLFITIVPYFITPLQNKLLVAISMALFIIPMLLSMREIWRFPKRRENPFIILYLVSLVLFLVVGSSTQIFLHDYFMLGLITNTVLMFAQMIMLSQNYADAFKKVEETNANLEHLVEERTKDLAITTEAMKEMIGNISHDLKTPLTALSQNLELLYDKEIPTDKIEREDYLNIAYHKNLDLQRLIKNLFEVNRIETGQVAYSLEWIRVSTLFADITEKYNSFVRSKGLVFEAYTEEDTEIQIDIEKIWSVFDNLIYNAMRYTKIGGKITVSFEVKENGIAEIVISDTGCGIASEHLPHIFEQFYKVSKSRNERDGDSGMGLYIVKTNVEGMGGTVTVKSVLEQGTKFVLAFKTKILKEE